MKIGQVTYVHALGRSRRSFTATLCLLAAAAMTLPAEAQQVEVTLATQSDGTRVLAHEITIPASVSEVWRAVTTPDGSRTWAVPFARAVPKSGDRFETGYDPSTPAALEQQWIDRRAPLHATFRTTRAPKGFPHADAYLLVTTQFVLTPVSRHAIRVRLEGRGYPVGSDGDALIGCCQSNANSSPQDGVRSLSAAA